MKQVFPYTFLIDCNKEGKISFFSESNVAGIANSLQSLFQEQADIYSVEDDQKQYETVTTLYSRKEGKLATYRDDQVFMFILAQLQPYTRIRIWFDIQKSLPTPATAKEKLQSNNQSTFEGIITVEGKTKYDRNKVMAIEKNYFRSYCRRSILVSQIQKRILAYQKWRKPLWCLSMTIGTYLFFRFMLTITKSKYLIVANSTLIALFSSLMKFEKTTLLASATIGLLLFAYVVYRHYKGFKFVLFVLYLIIFIAGILPWIMN